MPIVQSVKKERMKCKKKFKKMPIVQNIDMLVQTQTHEMYKNTSIKS